MFPLSVEPWQSIAPARTLIPSSYIYSHIYMTARTLIPPSCRAPRRDHLRLLDAGALRGEPRRLRRGEAARRGAASLRRWLGDDFRDLHRLLSRLCAPLCQAVCFTHASALSRVSRRGRGIDSRLSASFVRGRRSAQRHERQLYAEVSGLCSAALTFGPRSHLGSFSRPRFFFFFFFSLP
eukprot:SAG11_NODE_555_length_8566_cov_15.547774_9_plen_180_part_00